MSQDVSAQHDQMYDQVVVNFPVQRTLREEVGFCVTFLQMFSSVGLFYDVYCTWDCMSHYVAELVTDCTRLQIWMI